MSTDIVIVAAARTAVGKFGGTLASTPAPELGAAVIAELNKATRAALTDKTESDKLLAKGAEPAPSTPQELAAVQQKDAAKWAALIKAKNIKDDQ